MADSAVMNINEAAIFSWNI